MARDIAALDAQLEMLMNLPLESRREYLAQIEATDPTMAESLRKLLRMVVEADTLSLKQAGSHLHRVAEELPAPHIAGYRIEGELGRGGMAIVYGGVRLVSGSEQPVAIKVLRQWLPGAIDRARFLNEQHILARLKHPNIATLLDVGVADERAYMVLERIDGVPIDLALNPNREDFPRIVSAILRLCDALSLAHQHLVIHRDIKPSNVLMAHGEPKLIDFGIAKVLDDTLDLRADKTRTGAAPMTLRYASPEQLLGRPVGVASDVYQLGLLMFHLLTARWPYADADAAWPSERLHADTRLIAPSESVVDGAQQRLLRGDIDAIVLKCLQFDPSDRYRSAAELGDDLQRFRAALPVRARRATASYRLARFVKRRRLGVAVTAAVVGIVVVAGVSALRLAQQQAEHALRIDRVLQTMTQMLEPADPYLHQPGSVTVSAVVDAASDDFLTTTPADREFHRQILQRLAQLQGTLQNYSKALALWTRALELAPADQRAPVAAEQIQALARSGEQDAALDAIANFTRTYDKPPPDTLVLARARILSDRAEFDAALRELDAIDLNRAEPRFRYDVLAERAILLQRTGDADAALKVYAEAETLIDRNDPRQSQRWFNHRGNVATALGNAGRPDQAAEQLLSLIGETQKRLGSDHPRPTQTVINAAIMLVFSAQNHRALELLQGVDQKRLENLDPQARAHLLLIRSRVALSIGANHDVFPTLLTSLETVLGVLGRDSPRLADYLGPLAWALYEFNEPALAETVARTALKRNPVHEQADLTLQLLGELGTLPDRPDPAFDARKTYECDRAEYVALRAALRGESQPQKRVPSDCPAQSAMQMEALGLTWDAPPGTASTRELRSPLLQRLSPKPHIDAIPAVLESADRARLIALLKQL